MEELVTPDLVLDFKGEAHEQKCVKEENQSICD